MSFLALAGLLALAPTGGDVALEVRGDPALAAWLEERVGDTWPAGPDPAHAGNGRFVVRVARVDARRVHVDVLDGQDILVARDLEGEGDVLAARVWLVVRSTIERARTELPAAAPPVRAAADAAAGAPGADAARGPGAAAFGVSLAARAVVDGGVPALGAVAGVSWSGALVAVPVHARVDAGTTHRASTGLVVHGVPVGAAAFVLTGASGVGVSLGAGLRGSAAVTVASAADAGAGAGKAPRSAWGVTCGLGPALRVGVDVAETLSVFGEAALEVRLSRQAWRLDDGRVEEPLVALPVLLGVEWRFGGAS